MSSRVAQMEDSWERSSVPLVRAQELLWKIAMMNTSNNPEVSSPNFFAVKQSQAFRDAEARIEATKAHIKELREEAEREDKRLKESTQAQRDQAREDDRCALLVGRVVLKFAGENTNTWNALWPKIVKSLAQASDADRALFELPPVPRRDEKQVSEAASPAATDLKKIPAVGAPAVATDQKQASEAAAPAVTEPKKKEPAKVADER